MDKKTLAILTGITALALTYRWLIKKPKGKFETKSGFLGSPFGKRVMFTLTNNTAQAQVVPLFNAYNNIQNPNVGISPSINEFNRYLLNEPKLVKAIEIRAGSSQSQAEKPIQIMCKDASGEFKGSNLYPLVSAYQNQPNMTTVEPNNLILSGECYINYTVDPNQSVVLILHYDLAPSTSQAATKQSEASVKKTVEKTPEPQTVQKALPQQGLKPEKKFNAGALVLPVAVGVGVFVLASKLTTKS
jgi:hypothetical protein